MTDEPMFFHIKTADPRTSPSEYVDEKFLLFDEYTKWENDGSEDRIEVATLLCRDNLQEAYDAITHSSIVVAEPDGYDHPKADLVLTVYDNYIE